MITNKKNIFKSENSDSFGSDEYDMVSSDDILLLTEQMNLEHNESTNNFEYKFLSKNQYEEEWNELYNNEEIDLIKLKKKCIDGQLKNNRFRSVCWRCLLGILHIQPKNWNYELEMYRKHYIEMYLALEQNPWNVKDKNPYDNPLSQDSDSIWQKYFCDEELKAVILQDVKRTFPGMEFFRNTDIQEIMVKILFCYAKQNPSLCYRQGMHEILAPVIYVLQNDQQAFLYAKEQIPHLDKNISYILNPEYFESDAYGIFKHIMNHIECSYRLKNLLANDTAKCDIKTCQSEVISRLDFIKTNLLQAKDPELSAHLDKLDIPLHLFGLRWLRLLFGCEFPLADLLVLWDFIFSNNFESVNFIVVAMLIAIRHILLKGDYTDCLCNLMRYPCGVNILFIINYSLHLTDPQKHPCPDLDKSFYQLEITKRKSGIKSVNSYSKFNRREKKTSSAEALIQASEKSKSVPVLHSADDDSSACGLALNDYNFKNLELEQTQTLLNVIRHNLEKFYSILSINLRNNDNVNVQAALDGLFELTCLLRTYSKESNCEIETACEAGEAKDLDNTNPQNVAMTKRLYPADISINGDKKLHTLPRTKKGFRSKELKVFKHHIGGVIEGVPMTDPLHLIKKLP